MTLRRAIFFILVPLLLVGVRPTPARAYTTISANLDFYDDLSPYGSWVHVSHYGDCWQPYRRVRSWRPYTVGYWVDTDYGWLWVSQDPWGDIPYHYGRWVYDPYYGWVWVPDDDLVWAPAWVSWRYSDAYVGWAPLPPEADWYGGGLSVNISIIDRRIPSSGWCFTPIRDFGTTRVRYDILPTTRNVTLISQTRNVTQYSSYRSYPVNRGPDPRVIERATGRRIERYQVSDARSGRIGRPSIQGRRIDVYRPRITGVQRQRERFVPLGRGGPSQEASPRGNRRGSQMWQRERDRAQQDMEMRRQQDMRMRQQREDRGQGGPPDRGRYRDRGQGGGPPDRGQYRDRGQGGGGGEGGRGGGRDQGPPPDQGNRPDRGNQGGGQERGRGGDQGRGRGQDRGNKGQGDKGDKANKDDKGDNSDNGGQGGGGGQNDQQDRGRGHGRGHGG